MAFRSRLAKLQRFFVIGLLSLSLAYAVLLCGVHMRETAIQKRSETLYSQFLKLESMFLRADGAVGKSHQQPRMEAALKASGIERHIRFHDLRHTFATLLAMNGPSMQLIANQLGHSGTRLAEKVYAHFSPAYVASTVRANKPNLVPRVASGEVFTRLAS